MRNQSASTLSFTQLFSPIIRKVYHSFNTNIKFSGSKLRMFKTSQDVYCRIYCTTFRLKKWTVAYLTCDQTNCRIVNNSPTTIQITMNFLALLRRYSQIDTVSRYAHWNNVPKFQRPSFETPNSVERAKSRKLVTTWRSVIIVPNHPRVWISVFAVDA